MFLISSKSEAHCSYKIVLIKKKRVTVNITIFFFALSPLCRICRCTRACAPPHMLGAGPRTRRTPHPCRTLPHSAAHACKNRLTPILAARNYKRTFSLVHYIRIRELVQSSIPVLLFLYQLAWLRRTGRCSAAYANENGLTPFLASSIFTTALPWFRRGAEPHTLARQG